MSDHLHKDNLDDFLKKAFDHYSESPSADMWERIEKDLPPERPSFRRFWLIAGLATLFVLLSLVAVQQFYFHQKIEKLENEVRQTEQAMKDMKSEEEERRRKGAGENGRAGAEENGSEGAIKKANASIAGGQQISKSAAKANAQNAPTELKSEPHIAVENAVPSTLLQPTPVIISPNTQLQITESNQENAAFAETQNPENQPVLDRLAILDLQNFSQTTATPVLAVSTKSFPAAVASKPHFSVGAFTMPTLTWKEIEITQQPPPRPGPPRPPFVKDSIHNPAFSVQYGLTANYAFNQNWSVESGLWYQSLEQTTTHQPRLEHRFGKCPDPRSNIARNCEFNYDLNNGNGDAEISFRVEQVDTTERIQPTERVAMQVTSTLKTTQLSIPLMVKYNFQKGKWRFSAKAGGLASVYTKSDLRVDKLESLNPKFRVRQEDRPEAKVTTTPKNSLDLVLGLGVGYSFNDRFSVIIEPTYLRQLTESNASNFFKTTEQAVGISAGIFYRI